MHIKKIHCFDTVSVLMQFAVAFRSPKISQYGFSESQAQFSLFTLDFIDFQNVSLTGIIESFKLTYNISFFILINYNVFKNNDYVIAVFIFY